MQETLSLGYEYDQATACLFKCLLNNTSVRGDTYLLIHFYCLMNTTEVYIL